MSEPLLKPEDWLREHGDYLYRFAIARVDRSQVAEDLISETYLAAMRGKDRFEGRSSERTWLVSILKHKIVDYFRKKGREQSFTDLEIMGEADSDRLFAGNWKFGDGPKSQPPWPGEGIEHKEFRQAVDRCLKTLPPRVAAIFRLREIENIEIQDICRDFDITPNNLSVMMHRARASLRSALERTYFSEDSR